MSAHVQLLTLDRHDGAERLVVRWLGNGQRHAVELAVERRTGDGWALRYRVVIQLAEVFGVHDAIGRACALAKAVRR
jgi:hypothetical protein